ncbi:helicase domino-like [Drosophila pseudoobscura]|uniref:Helicase domino-like n=1 Tax=Drosophila pseudoobscura pseudoobscura TaxID=46245 RepID=A0A6I8VU16_DROPS|nr:helicase domino-like [Drosophila pseudoobscura]
MSFNINFNCGPPPVGQNVYKIGELEGEKNIITKESILECINSLPKCENLTLQQKPEVGCQQTANADDSFDCSNLTAAQLEQLALLTAAANPGQSSVSLMVMIPVESLLDIVQVLSGTAAQIVSMSSTVLKGNSSKGTTSEVPIWVDAGVGVPPSVGKIDMEMYQSPADKPSVVVQTQSKSTHNPSFRILEHVIIPSQQPGSIGSLCKQEQQQKATTAGGSAQCYWRVVAVGLRFSSFLFCRCCVDAVGLRFSSFRYFHCRCFVAC